MVWGSCWPSILSAPQSMRLCWIVAIFMRFGPFASNPFTALSHLCRTILMFDLIINFWGDQPISTNVTVFGPVHSISIQTDCSTTSFSWQPGIHVWCILNWNRRIYNSNSRSLRPASRAIRMWAPCLPHAYGYRDDGKRYKNHFWQWQWMQIKSKFNKNERINSQVVMCGRALCAEKRTKRKNEKVNSLN